MNWLETAGLRDALGKMPDEEVVLKFNLRVSAAAVAHHRVKAQIPSFHNARRKVVWSDAHLSMLGDTPDEEVAALMQIHKDTVAAKRRMIGRAKFICR
jgi:hypothetical protein